MSIRVTMLGCGSSAGVPEIGCSCEVCTSDDPKNKRSRVSILIETQGKRLLVDTSPDLRMQALEHKINYIDAILYTHDHADHIHGIDDVRPFNAYLDRSLPIFADSGTLASLLTRFPYIFQPKPQRAWYRPSLIPHEIPTDPLRRFTVEGVEILPLMQYHAETHSLGFRIGNFAYSTDTNGFPEETFRALEGLDVWVVDCLRYAPSFTHSRLEMTLEWAARLKPKLTVLTHMAHQFDYARLSHELPPGIVPGYDGLVLDIA